MKLVKEIMPRERTEWIETVKLGVNFLAGTNERLITRLAKQILRNLDEFSEKFRDIKNPYINECTRPSKAIVDAVHSLM